METCLLSDSKQNRIMPNPRPRSNALSGKDDPRWPSSIEMLKIELNRPFVMAESLATFIHKVYKSPVLMSAPASLSRKIYDLYVGGGQKSISAPFERCKSFINKVWSKVLLDKKLKNAFLQREIDKDGAPVSLQCLVTEVNAGLRDLSIELNDFIYFRITDDVILYRVYANVKFDLVPEAVAWIGKYINENPGHGIASFKLAGPAVCETRKDTIVIFCISKEVAEKIASELVQLHGYFNASIPEMTTPVQGGEGVAIGAEPVWQKTGLRSKKKWDNDPEDAQSFGTLRCEIIAAAVHNFNANKQVCGDSFEVFKKFVAVGFRGCGLDPARPGG